jgi:tRNA-dependent cyclodipeptide synthase
MVTHGSTGRVFVGISLSNKKLTIEGVRSAVVLARETFAAHHVAFLIADELEFINLRVFDHGSVAKFDAVVESRAAVLEDIISDALRTAPVRRLNWTISRWQEILGAEYWALYTDLLGLFIESRAFRRDVNAVAHEFARRRGRVLSQNRIHHLSLYIIAELPTLMQGVRIRNRKYNSMIYPARGTESLDRITDHLERGSYGSLRVERTCAVLQTEVGLALD